jgi:hypothetical protein
MKIYQRFAYTLADDTTGVKHFHVVRARSREEALSRATTRAVRLGLMNWTATIVGTA